MHLPAVNRTAATVQSLLLTALPHGGQRSARRNAWASMSTDSTRARARREADLAMDGAVAASQHAAQVAASQHRAAGAR